MTREWTGAGCGAELGCWAFAVGFCTPKASEVLALDMASGGERAS